MKTYEVVIERLQPSCGGKSPKDVKLTTVTTDDPAAYVRQMEPTGELEVTTKENGDIAISIHAGLKSITYTFSEE